jgi:hypothetical protein
MGEKNFMNFLKRIVDGVDQTVEKGKRIETLRSKVEG